MEKFNQSENIVECTDSDQRESAHGPKENATAGVTVECWCPDPVEIDQGKDSDLSTLAAESGESDIRVPVRPVAGAAPPTQKKRATTSHHAYAVETLDHLSVGESRPVFYQGELFVFDDSESIWVPFPKADLLRTIAELHDGKTNCTKWVDYSGIAEQAIAVANEDDFFRDPAVGVACASRFYAVLGESVAITRLEALHRQRVMLDFQPAAARTPNFDAFLHQTFRSDAPGEEAAQIALVQEIAGAVLLGIMPRYHKAVLFYDPYGRAGKGTLERIITRLVPEEFTSAVSPFRWNREYFLASLIGSRLNVVGELPEGESIPAHDFKSVIGGDKLSGRHPAKPVVLFQNEAAHIFTSNHLITTRDHSEAFYSRWLLVEFPNSLLKSGLAPDVTLLDRIIPQELPGIAYWAMQGGIRLLNQGRFSPSLVHDRLMQKWRRSASSVDEFIHECCEVSPELLERRASFYGSYTRWCQENGRKPLSKANVKEHMEHRVGLPVRFTTLDGNEVVRGVGIRQELKDRWTSFT